MRNWTHWFSSLQFRLILAFAVILALALASVSYSLGQAAAKELLRVVPHFTIELARTATTGIREEDLPRLLDGLRKAGLPE